MPATTAVAANAAGLARGNSGGGARGASAGSRITHHASLLALNFQPSTLNFVLASSQSVGGAGGGLGLYFRGEFFHPRHVAEAGGEVRAAVAGSDGGTAETAVAVCRTRRAARDARRRPAKDFHAETARRAGGDFGGIKNVGDDVRSLKLKAKKS